MSNKKCENSYDIVIIGAGVVGGMIAHKLSRYNNRVCIVDGAEDVAMGASKANSGIVHAGFDAEEGSLKAKLNLRGSEIMAQVAKDLGVKYKNNGSLVVAYTQSDVEILEEIHARGVANGVKNLEIIDKKTLHNLEPGLADTAIAALHAPTGAIICPYELTMAAIGNAMDNGTDLVLDFPVNKIIKDDDFYVVCSGERSVKGRFVVNAAGQHADEVAALVGNVDFTIHPRKGEYILLDKTCGNLASHTIFKTPTKMGKGILITPTVDGNLLLGPTSVDLEKDADCATTPEGLEIVVREATEHLPAISMRDAITSFSGLRASCSRKDFVIEKFAENFINVAGIDSPGLSSAPAIGEMVAELLSEMGMSTEEKADFIATREPDHIYQNLSMDEKNQWIKRDPSYGKIVCRCEGISQGEILHALRTNPKARDVDGVKRRTRSGMGRCQGGFCMPHVAEIIAEENGIPLEDVTKSGPASKINLGKMK